MKLEVLYEDEAVIVVVKPAGVLSQSDRSTDLDMVDYVKNYLYETHGKKGIEVGLIHRLDRPVGGVMVFGKKKEATAHLNKQIQDKTIQKNYVAVLTKHLEPTSEYKNLTDYLIKDGKTNLSVITTSANKQAKKAVLNYRILGCEAVEGEDLSLAEIELLTGRHHQIRVQMSKEAGGLWGDTKYNKEFQTTKKWVNVGLYSYKLSFLHPKTKKRVTFVHTPEDGIFTSFQKELEIIGNKKQR